MIDLRKIATDLGGDVYAGGNAATVPGPGHSKHDRSLSLRVSDDGQRVIYFSFAGKLDHREVMAYLGIDDRDARPATSFERQKAREQRERERRAEEARDLALCKSIWQDTEDLAGSPAEAYLWARGLIAEGVPDLRFHRSAPRGKAEDAQRHPAMVALVREPSGAPRALHLTFIRPDGAGKAFGDRSRVMLGPVRGNAVHLAPAAPVMAVGEGIETCAAYTTMKGLPAWSALSTSGLRTFNPPPRLRRLIVCADGDKAGMDAAQELAQRVCRYCDVEIDPAPDGQDWADILKEQA